MPLIRSLLKRDWFVGLVITLLFLLFAEAGWFSALDRQAYNLGAKFSVNKAPREDIVVVAIDDKSLQALGAWPWSRDVLAETTHLLTRVKTRVVGFTMPFDTGQYEGPRLADRIAYYFEEREKTQSPRQQGAAGYRIDFTRRC